MKFSDPYNLIILLCGITLLSYIFNIISEKSKIPSVILLIGSGLILQAIARFYKLPLPALRTPLELLGIIGLIMIVLEGAMDLKISKDKKPVMLQALIAGAGLLLITAFGIAEILHYFGKLEFRTALVYAVPMGIISSAIAIPTASNLSSEKREFITYESTISDVLGIMMFNYVIADELLTFASIQTFLFGLFLIIYISVLSSVILLWLSKYLKTHLKVLPILSVLILLYALAKLIHLPSLFLILVFGLVINNIPGLLQSYSGNWKPMVEMFFNQEKLQVIAREMKSMTGELAFLIRTFFFLIFGFTMDLSLLKSTQVWMIGSLIVLLILLVRYFFLRFILQTKVVPEVFIAPRGLISILLFYSIP